MLPTPANRRIALCPLITALITAILFIQPVQSESPTDGTANASNPKASAPSAPSTGTGTDVKVGPPKPDLAAPRIALLLKSKASGAPIPKAMVQLRRIRMVDDLLVLDEAALTGETDQQGLLVLTLGVDEAAQSANFDISVTGFAPEMEAVKIHRARPDPEPQELMFRPGRELSTQVFDADGRPAVHARATILADTDSPDYDIWRSLRLSDAQGRLTIQIPDNATFGVTVRSELGAPFRAVFPATTTSLRPIYLLRGTVVTGQLLNREGQPVPNCPIILEGDDSQAVSTEFEVKRHGGGSLDLAFTRRTDSEGRYRFPPMAGSVRVYLDDDEARSNSRHLVPVSLDLPASGESWMPLMLAPTGIISGKITWPDGRPVNKLEITLLCPPRRSLSYITLNSASSNAEGRYQLAAPFPCETVSLNGGGARGPDGEYWVAVPLEHDGTTGNRMKVLERYVGSPMTVDWVMVKDEEHRKRNRRGQPNSTDGEYAGEKIWGPLAQLEREIAAAQDAYRKLKSNDERDRLDPRYVMVNRCLEFEAQHRGTRLAVGALHYVMRAAATSTGPIVEDARLRAIEILAQHYVAHPDLDLLINEFDTGNGVPEAEPFLRMIADQSPYDYVRATALYELADLLLLMRRMKDHVYQLPESSPAEQEAMIKIQSSESTKIWLRNQFIQGRRMRLLLAQHNSNDLRDSALDLLDRISTRYANVITPRRIWESAADLDDAAELKLVDQPGLMTWRIATIAERARNLRFQLTRLQPGMKAPEIDGLDLNQQPIRLSQFQGRVVLLTTTQGNTENELYAQCASLLTTLKDQPFTCLSVIPGSGGGGYSVRAIVEDGQVTWPIIRDSAEDEIADLWCQETFPEIYLIDQQGIIRHHFTSRIDADSVEGQIRELLKPLNTK